MKIFSSLLLATITPLLALGCVTELGEKGSGPNDQGQTGTGGDPGLGPDAGTGGLVQQPGGTGGGLSGSGGGIFGGTGGAGVGTGGAGTIIGGGTGGAGDEMTFMDVYEFLCVDCHGPNGDGIDGKAPDIKHPVRDYSEWVIRNGRGKDDDQYGVFSTYYEEDMEAFDETLLPQDMLEQILDWLASQPQPMTGQGLYEDYCAACHGPDAQGGLTDRPITMETQEALDNIRSGKHLGEFDNRHEFMPKQTPEEISDEEIQRVIDYILTL